MKRNLFFILILCLAIPLYGAKQKLKKEYKERRHLVKTVELQYRFNGTIGWLNRDEKIVGDSKTTGFTLDRPVVLGGTFAIEFMPSINHTAFRQWNNTSVGLAITALDFGQNQYLGQAFAIYPYLNVPLVKRPHFVLGLRPGMGAAFVTRTYASTVPDEYRWNALSKQVSDNPVHYQLVANTSVGSILNAWITAGMYIDVPINDEWAINFSAGWQHISNGSVMTPNAGYNMANAELGVTYHPSSKHRYYEPPSLVPHRLYDGVTKKWDVEIGIAGGCRSVYYRDQNWFGVGSFGIAGYWRPISIFRLGGGVDVYYDGGYSAIYYNSSDKYDLEYNKRIEEYIAQHPNVKTTKYGKTYLKESTVSNCFRVGISIQPEMVLGDFTIGYHMGIYLYDPVKNMEPMKEARDAEKNGTPLNRGIFYTYDPSRSSTYQDGWFYQKLQMKYHCTKHLYVQIGLKLHVTKAEFIDAGIGLHI